jgi:hypothetical protein
MSNVTSRREGGDTQLRGAGMLSFGEPGVSLAAPGAVFACYGPTVRSKYASCTL